MSSSIVTASEDINSALNVLSPEDQQFFSDAREKYAKRGIADSPLLDQLCWLRLIMGQLADNFAASLSAHEEKLKNRIDTPGGWRKLRTIKSSGEFESPMPWLHPFKLCLNALQPLEAELENAISSGETKEKDLTELRAAFAQYKLQFPLQPLSLKPKYPPRPTRIFK